MGTLMPGLFVYHDLFRDSNTAWAFQSALYTLDIPSPWCEFDKMAFKTEDLLP